MTAPEPDALANATTELASDRTAHVDGSGCL